MMQGNLFRTVGYALAAIVGLAFTANSYADDTTHMTKQFQGAKANTGKVIHSKRGDLNVLTLTDDFKVPDTPAPHWQVLDSDGNVYLLKRLLIKGDKFNKSITLPPYIKDVKKVQIWCAWAESVLGETDFETPVK
jgi:hypothetical protein